MNTSQYVEEGPLRGSAERFRHEFERWLEAVRSQGERAMDAIGLRPGALPIDLIETPETIVIRANVPGVSLENLDLAVAGHMLTLQVAFPAAQQAGETAHVQERPRGEFRRSIPLPAGVDADSIQAECKHGVLEVTASKLEREKPRKIPVRSTVSTTSAPQSTPQAVD